MVKGITSLLNEMERGLSYPTDDDARAARRLAAQTRHVGRVSGRQPWREALWWISRGWLGRHAGWLSVPQLDTLWRDTVSAERSRSPALPRVACLRVVCGS
jgi:hypothetical protein